MESSNLTKFGGLTPYDKIIEMHGLYVNRKHQILSLGMNKPETKSLWFEMADFGKFAKRLLDDVDISGLRLYLGNYDAQHMPQNPIHVDNMTIGLVPTVYDPKTNKHLDYPLVKRTFTEFVFIPGNGYNHGTICPPDQCP